MNGREGAGASTLDSGEAGKRAIIDLIRGCSIEISPRRAPSIDLCRQFLDPGTAIYLTDVAGDVHDSIVALAIALRKAGFDPVPHIAARSFAGFRQLDALLARAAGEAGVVQALVIGGDQAVPAGPFASSLEVLATGLFEKHGISRIGIAGYPEGHPRIAAPALDEALQAKIETAHARQFDIGIVTQFCFDASPIVQWIERSAASRGGTPVRVGLAAPASAATLIKFAVRCGIGNSWRFLMGRGSSIARMVTESGPEPIIGDLARPAAASARSAMSGLHFYTFGGLPRTAAWLRAILDGAFELIEPGGFRILAK